MGAQYDVDQSVCDQRIAIFESDVFGGQPHAKAP